MQVIERVNFLKKECHWFFHIYFRFKKKKRGLFATTSSNLPSSNYSTVNERCLSSSTTIYIFISIGWHDGSQPPQGTSCSANSALSLYLILSLSLSLSFSLTLWLSLLAFLSFLQLWSRNRFFSYTYSCNWRERLFTHETYKVHLLLNSFLLHLISFKS